MKQKGMKIVTSSAMVLTVLLSSGVTGIHAQNSNNGTVSAAVQKGTNQKLNSTAKNVLATGVWGTATWTLNDDGSLVVDGGTVSGPLFKAPGIAAVEDKITSISFSGVGGKTKTEANGSEFLGSHYNYPLGKVKTIDLANVDTSATTNFDFFLNSHPVLEEVKNMQVLDTSKATSMNAFFSGNNIIKSVDLSSLDTSNVTDFTNMFVWDNALTKLDLSNFTIKSTAKKSLMLGQLQSLRVLVLGNKIDNISGTGFERIQGTSDRNNRGPQYVTGDNWRNIGNGSTTWPTGSIYGLASDIETNFNGATDADTYVWMPIETGNITVNYVDEAGNPIANPTTLTPNGYLGDSYTTSPKSIDGYTLVTTPDNANGVYTESAQEVTYVYKKNGEIVYPTLPVDPPAKPNNPAPNKPVTNDPVVKRHTVVTKKPVKKLPQTSELNTIGLSIVGIGLLIGLTSYLVIKRKKA